MENGNIKDTFTNLKNKILINKYVVNAKNSNFSNRLNKERLHIKNLVMKNKGKTIIIICFFTILWLYFFHIFNRVPRYLKKMNIYDNIINNKSLSSCKIILKNDYKLCDFYIASSYKSYLPCTNYYDYSSCRAIEKVLIYGARYIDLDIYNKNFNICTKPIVCNGSEIGNWHWTSELDFDKICRMISLTAFSSKVNSPNDPLFINLNLYVNNNYYTINKIADSITKYFSQRLLPSKFSYQGINPNPKLCVDISTTSIHELFGKIIIICNNGFKHTKLDELVNISPSIVGNLRDLKYSEVKDSYNINELISYNKKYLTRVTIDIVKRNKNNFNWATPWYTGSQFVCMDYFNQDPYMLSYIKRFSKCSFVLKPYKLRYQPTTINPPLKQLPDVSFAPQQVTTPTYSIMY